MIETRGFVAGDEDDFLGLYRDCLGHYGIAPATMVQEARVLDILGSGRHMSCLLAFADTRPIGFATWTLTFPAAAGVALYMKELFVSQRARGKGAGRALMAGLIQMAVAENCVRIDWQTDGKNQVSQRFYHSINAPGYEKRTFRVDASDYQRFLSSLG